MHTKIDYDMHVKFGYMQDIYEDCLKCTNKRIREKYPDVMNIIEIEDIIRFREMLEGDKDIKIQFILFKHKIIVLNVAKIRRIFVLNKISKIVKHECTRFVPH